MLQVPQLKGQKNIIRGILSFRDKSISEHPWQAKLIDQKPNVFHAYYYPKTDGQSPGEESPQSREARMNHNRKMYELLSRHNIELDSVKIANGDTKIEMKHYLKNIGANILIIGGLAKGILERMVVGSTAENILDDITCDLLILKTNAD